VLAAQNATINATAKSAVCGNGSKEGGEQCDTADFDGVGCPGIGFDGGALGCAPSCEYDASACVSDAASVGQDVFLASVGGAYTLTETDGERAGISLPTNAFFQDLHLYLFSHAAADILLTKPAPSGFLTDAHAYDFSFVDQDGDRVDTLQRQATLTLHYTDADAQGIDETSLRPYHWNAGLDAWQAVSGSVLDTANNDVDFVADTFSVYMLMGAPPTAVSSAAAHGGGAPPVSEAGVTFSGLASPGSRVILLKDGQVAAYVSAGPDGAFLLGITGLSPGSYHFGLEMTDTGGLTGPLTMFPLMVAPGAQLRVGDIVLSAPPKQETPPPMPPAASKKTPPAPKPPVRCDLNDDRSVNLVDFSIAAYWYGRAACPAAVDLNGDGKITLTDLSILAAHWTG